MFLRRGSDIRICAFNEEAERLKDSAMTFL